MKRRSILKAMSMAPPSAMLAAQAPATPPRTAKATDPEPKAFFYDDGRHAAGLYQFAPPLTAADVTYTVDQLVASGIDTLFYSAGPEGGVVQYDSRVAAKWGDNVDVWSHEIFYRASRTLHQLIADGIDPMKALCDRSHEKGILFLPTVCVCIQGGDRKEDLGLGRKSNFAYDHPQYQVGLDTDPRANEPARFFGPARFSFLHEEVRQERFRICEELLTRYETDGIELDLSIDNDFGPLCKYGEVGLLAPVLTQWIADLRAVARKAEQSQGRRKRIYVRIPAVAEDGWSLIGFDVPGWVSKRLVDGFVCLTTYRNMVDQDMDLAPVVRLTRGTGCRVLAGFDGNLGRQMESSPTAEMIWAAATNAYDRGADGFGLCEGMWAPNGWPWTAQDRDTLRLLGHPDLLATANKVYRARSRARGSAVAEGIFRTRGPVLPRELKQGESLDVPLRIASHLDGLQATARVAAVRLRVRFANLEPSLNDVRVEFNGRALPDAMARKIDLHFHVIKPGPINPYGYIYEYLLTPELYPKAGDNVVKVTLAKRDPKLRIPFEVYDVDCSIEYRLHRHFEQRPIEY